MNNLVTCNNLTLGYENIPIIEEINIQVEKGDYLCIVGENGCGKSTLVKAILGFIKPIKGNITVSPELKHNGIGYLPQQTLTQKDFPASVQEIVLSGCLSSLGLRPFYNRREKELVRINMEKMGISNLAKKCYRELSGGQQQKVLLARALCATKELLVIDEPTAGLDPLSTQELYSLIHKINQEDNVAIIMVSHDIENVLSQAKTIMHLQRNILYYGAANEYCASTYKN